MCRYVMSIPKYFRLLINSDKYVIHIWTIDIYTRHVMLGHFMSFLALLSMSAKNQNLLIKTKLNHFVAFYSLPCTYTGGQYNSKHCMNNSLGKIVIRDKFDKLVTRIIVSWDSRMNIFCLLSNKMTKLTIIRFQSL